MSHTSGPWTLHIGSPREAYVEAMDGDIMVAECHDGEAEANARLIAAAPEMLEALRRLLTLSRTDFETIPVDQERYYVLNPGVKLARAAIAKAEG